MYLHHYSPKPSDPITSNVGSRIAGPSRLVFKIPNEAQPIPYNLNSLLDWSAFELSVAPAALSPTPPSKPEQTHTAIEAPYRLILSPNKLAGWAHSCNAVSQKNGQVELWHTRLGVKRDNGIIDEKQDYYRTLRAIWSGDYVPDGDCPKHSVMPIRMSLDQHDRCELVSLTANPWDSNWESRVIRVNHQKW